MAPPYDRSAALHKEKALGFRPLERVREARRPGWNVFTRVCILRG